MKLAVITEPTPSGGSYTVTAARVSATLWRVSWSLTRGSSVVGGSQARRSEQAAVELAEQTVARLRQLTERDAA